MSPDPFSIEIAASAWRALARVSIDAFRDIRQQLERVADELVKSVDAGRGGEVTVDVGHYLVRCTVDSAERKIVVEEIERRLPEVG